MENIAALRPFSRSGAVNMRAIRRVGIYADVVDGRSPEDAKNGVLLGIRNDSFQQYVKRGLASPIAQYYGIVQEDLMLARHLFRGLKRPLMHNGNMQADRNVLVYSWRSVVDYKWVGTPLDGHPERMNPPPGQVFVVIVREEQSKENDILGSIERWNWVREDPQLAHAPVDWQQRYGTHLWSRDT